LGTIYSTKVIWHVRNIQQNFILKYLINKFSEYDCVKKIICVSIATQNQFKSNNKTVVINNGIDTEEYNLSRVEKLLRKEYAIPSEKIIIGTAGRVVPRKNFDHFINIGIEICKKYKKDCVFVLVGDTPFYFKQSLIENLKSMTKKANLESKFIFTGYKNKVESYIADFDIFFIPSMYEDPFPRVVIESMALSKPIIGYRIGGIGETIDDGINGYSFNLKDNNLIEKIIELIEDKELRLKMSFESRKKSVNQYDSRVIASKIISEIKSLRS
jgi:glycosyltransferase involved in cell wall biosynthesis